MQHRNKILFSFIFVMSFVCAKAQTGSPSGFPAPYSTGYYRVGWLQSDSGSIWATRDTTVRSKYPGLNFLWLHSGSDTSHWSYDGRAYFRDFNTKDTLPYNQKLATPYWVLSHFQPSGSYQSALTNTGSGFRLFDPSSSIRSLFCSGCSIDSTTNIGALTITVSGGSGNTNSNIGSGYRWAVPNTNNIKTFFAIGGNLDSTTNLNALTLTIPVYQSNLSNTGTGFRVFTPSGSIKSLVCSGCTIDSTTNSGSLTFTVTAGGSGTVTSVGQAVPASLLTIGGSPITTNGTLAIGLANAESNSVWGDSTGTAGTPGYYRPTPSLLNTWYGETIQSQISNSGSGFRWFVPGSSIRSFVCSGCTLDSITNAGSLTLTVTGGGSGTVTSVGLSLPSSFVAISGSPVTASGTLTGTLVNASAYNIWGNNTGSTATPGYFAPTSTILNQWFGGSIQAQLSGTGYILQSGTSSSFISGSATNLIGYNASGSGSAIVLGPNLSMTGNTLNATGGSSISLTTLPTTGVSPTLIANILNIDTFRYQKIFNIQDYGAVGDSATDNTAAIQNAILAAFNAGGGEVLIPNGIFLVKGPLLATVGGRTCNCQLYIPLADSTSGKNAPAISFIGESMPSFEQAIAIQNWVTPRKAPIIESTIVGSGVTPCLIGTTSYLFHGEPFNQTSVYMDKLILRTSNLAVNGITDTAGTMTAANFYTLAEFHFGALRVDVTSGSLFNTVQPTSGATGIIMPRIDNSAWSIGDRLLIAGYDVGMQIGEHTDIKSIFVIGCDTSISVPASTYDEHIGRLLSQGSKWGVHIKGITPLNIDQYISEHLDSSFTGNKWFSFQGDVISDGYTYLTGITHYWIGDVSSGFVGINNGKFLIQNVRRDLFLASPLGTVPTTSFLDWTNTNEVVTIGKGADVASVWFGARPGTTSGTDTSTGAAAIIQRIRAAGGSMQFQFATSAGANTPIAGANGYFTALGVTNIGQLNSLVEIQFSSAGGGTQWGNDNTVGNLSNSGFTKVKGGQGIAKTSWANTTIQNAIGSGGAFYVNYNSPDSTHGGTTCFNIDGTSGNTRVGDATIGTALLTVAGSTATKSGFRLVAGNVPTSPNDGDVYNDIITHHIFAYLNGTQYQIDQQSASQTLTYTQNATNNNLAISGGNNVNFLTATSSLAGLLDTARAKFIDSLKNGLKTFNLYAANGLTAAGGDSIYQGGALNQNTSITLNSFNYVFNTTPGSGLFKITDGTASHTYSEQISGGSLFLTIPSAGRGLAIDSNGVIWASGNTGGAAQQLSSTYLVVGGTEVINGQVMEGWNLYTSNHSITASTLERNIYVDCSGGNVTITLPLASSVGNGTSTTGQGIIYHIKRIDVSANICTIATSGSDLIDGASSVTLTSFQEKGMQAVYNGSTGNYYVQ